MSSPFAGATAPPACSNCRASLQTGDRVCGACGASVAGCRSCGESLVAGDRFCPRCGTFVDVTAVGSGPGGQPTGGGRPSGETGDQWRRIVDRLRAATVGEFEIIREIGRGGMAAVYLGREIALNRKVAIKIMSPALLTGQGMIDRFRMEAITVANLSHPNIITIHAVRQIDDLHFFVMKFVEGRALDSILRTQGPLSVDTIRGLLFMVGSALAYAHRRGVIHRDTKPANILIDVDGNAVVTDFGIAKATEGPSHTQTGAVLGTLAYMSPEQCYGLPVSAVSDQYSLGVVAYELLTGTPPFSGSAYTIMHAHAALPVPSIATIRPDCPPEFEAAILRMMAKDPADRWPGLPDALVALGATALPDEHPVRLELSALARGVTPPPRPSATPVRRSELSSSTPIGSGGFAPSVPDIREAETVRENSLPPVSSVPSVAQPLASPPDATDPSRKRWYLAGNLARSRARWYVASVVLVAAVSLPLMLRGNRQIVEPVSPSDSTRPSVPTTAPDTVTKPQPGPSTGDKTKGGTSKTGDKGVITPQPPAPEPEPKVPAPETTLSLPASLSRLHEDARAAKAKWDLGEYVASDQLYEAGERRATSVLQRFPGDAEVIALGKELSQARNALRTACRTERDIMQKSQNTRRVVCP